MERRKELDDYNTYHDSDNLLLQFIMSEFLMAYLEVKVLSECAEELSYLLSKRSNNSQRKEAFHDLFASTERLSGPSFDYMRIFVWNQELGLLKKLTNYCALFSKSLSPEFKSAQTIYRHANQAWLESIQLHDNLFGMQAFPPKEWKEDMEDIKLSAEKIHNKMERFAKLLPQVIAEYAADENVMFFVLRHKEEFDDLYYAGFVKKLFNKSYYGGMEEAQEYITEQYQERGFGQLIEIIETKFDELQYTS